jgi:hypothetical protein
MSDAQKARGTRPPASGRPFTPEEDALLGTATDKEVAAKIGRSWEVVGQRRRLLKVPAFDPRRRGRGESA